MEVAGNEEHKNKNRRPTANDDHKAACCLNIIQH